MRSVTTDAPLDYEEIVKDLQDLIAALDRRVPHINRLGEKDIADDAARLRQKALKRLEKLQRTVAEGQAGADGQGGAR